MISKYFRVSALAFEMAFKQAATDAFILFGIFIQPLIIAMLGMYVLGDRGGNYAIFVVVGSGLTGLWTGLLFVSGNSITEERWTGTLEPLVGMPTPLPVIVIGKNTAYVLQSMGSMIVAYALAAIFFDYPLRVESPLLFSISIFLTILSFICFGLLIAPVFVMNPDLQRWQNGLEYPVYILGGFLFPILLLPVWTTPISYLLGPFWAARALHLSSSGPADLAEVTFSWGMMILFSLIYLVIGGILFRKMLAKARSQATLDRQ
jgi:ABC-2 type transport system permease protein